MLNSTLGCGVSGANLLKLMVGPCGLEPQTSKVSIRTAKMTGKAMISHKCNLAKQFLLIFDSGSGQRRTRKDSPAGL
jgi:hypothetical protein